MPPPPTPVKQKVRDAFIGFQKEDKKQILILDVLDTQDKKGEQVLLIILN
jgi:hypothetical protein